MTTIDPHASNTLRGLFINKAGAYPYLLPEAEIILSNAAGTKMTFRVTSPREAANCLQHCLNHDGDGLFNREDKSHSLAPLSFRMYKRMRIPPEHKEHVLLAFNIRYQDMAEKGHLWISDPEMTTYHWEGDQMIEDKPPITYDGPTIKELIQVMNAAGDDWKNVNFMLPEKKARIKLVSVNPR